MALPSSSTLRLPTPGVPAALDAQAGLLPPFGSTSSDAGLAAQQSASSAFDFPYAAAYPMQIDLMRAIFRAIEGGQVGVFESPTGTGKSLSLICAAFSWLRLNKARATEGQASDADTHEEPDWVVAHDNEKRRQELVRYENELKERIAKAREAQAREKKRAAAQAKQSEGNWRKKARGERAGDDSDSDAFLASDYSGDESGPSRGRPTPSDDSAFLSAEVRALMAEFEERVTNAGAPRARMRWGPGAEGEDEEPETLPRIFYVSRTHSQLAQFVAELRKTRFGRTLHVVDGTQQEEPARSISLGSRKQMCINAEVQRVGARAGAEAMNERCRELAKGGDKGKKRCEFLPKQDDAGKAQILDYRDRALAQVQDMEDLVALGRELHTCPYYAARTSARQAELVTLPYNLLLQPSARESLNISLAGSIVIVDEAHNLIDTILSVHSLGITSRQVTQAREQIKEYLRRFAGRLKGANEVNLRLLLQILEGLETFAAKWAAKHAAQAQHSAKGKGRAAEEIMTAAQLIKEMGGTLDQINLVKLERYLKDSQIARKVSGYADKRQAREAQRQLAEGGDSTEEARFTPSAISAMHAIEAFILSLANRTDDGRVLLSLEAATVKPAPAVGVPSKYARPVKPTPSTGPQPAGATDEGPIVSLKYQLLNPSEAFRPIVEEARAVILAGGTMEPISDFRRQLLPGLEERFATFSCGHIIPPSNLLATVVHAGPKGVPFEFKFGNRDDSALLDELATCLVNFSNVVPHGIVVFLPSYAFLDAAAARWKASGALARMGTKKKVFYEPKNAADVDGVLAEYTRAIDAPPAGGPHGALLLAVVGAKLSEGINFSDSLARAVVMVGMPFANVASVELNERMEYVRKLAKSQPGVGKSGADAGQELYINLCMRAVNQSIGRAIRHKDDYAALILLDRRYARPDIRARLPGWIREHTTSHERFGPVMGALGGFFRAKKAAAAAAGGAA